MQNTALQLHNTLVNKTLVSDEDDAEYFADAAKWVMEQQIAGTFSTSAAQQYLRTELDTMLYEAVFEEMGW